MKLVPIWTRQIVNSTTTHINEVGLNPNKANKEFNNHSYEWSWSWSKQSKQWIRWPLIWMKLASIQTKQTRNSITTHMNEADLNLDKTSNELDDHSYEWSWPRSEQSEQMKSITTHINEVGLSPKQSDMHDYFHKKDFNAKSLYDELTFVLKQECMTAWMHKSMAFIFIFHNFLWSNLTFPYFLIISFIFFVSKCQHFNPLFL